MIINNKIQGDNIMPRELEQPTTAVSADAAISALICLLHTYATQAGDQTRIGGRIYRHLDGLVHRDDLPAVLQKTCDELSDAWQTMPGIKEVRL
jgi:hypothetical protein